MRDEPWLEALREAVRQRKLCSPEENWDEMVRLGIIDEEGNVLVRMPQPPQRTGKSRKQSDEGSGKNSTQG